MTIRILKSPLDGRSNYKNIALALSGLIFVVLEIAFLLNQSKMTPVNSDGVQNVMEISSILHGNILLKGWVLPSDNFYLSDNFYFLATRLLLGKTIAAIYTATFLIYLTVVLTAAGIVLISTRDIRSRVIGLGAVVFYLGAPGSDGLGPVVFVGAQHIAELAFCLLAWLALGAVQTATCRRRVVQSAVLYAIAGFVLFVSDPIGTVVFFLPTLIGLSLAFLTDAGRRRVHGGLIGLTIVMFVGARLFLATIPALGGFATASDFSLYFVNPADLGKNAEGLFFGLLNLSGAYFLGEPMQRATTIVSLIRLAGLGLVMFATIAAIRRGTTRQTGWNLPLVVALAVLFDVAACLFSASFTVYLPYSVLRGGSSVRYLTPAILFGGLLVALELPRMLDRVAMPELRRAGGGVLAIGAVAATGLYFAQGVAQWGDKSAMAQSPAKAVGTWLLDHGLTHGVGTYWDASIVTAVSGEQVVVRAVANYRGHPLPYNYISDDRWYNPDNRPQFIIYNSNNQFEIDENLIKEKYGQPMDTKFIDGYVVDILNH